MISRIHIWPTPVVYTATFNIDLKKDDDDDDNNDDDDDGDYDGDDGHDDDDDDGGAWMTIFVSKQSMIMTIKTRDSKAKNVRTLRSNEIFVVLKFFQIAPLHLHLSLQEYLPF